MNHLFSNILVAGCTLLTCNSVTMAQDAYIGKNTITINDGLMTPEALWAMGRIGAVQASPNGQKIVYQVGYYSVKANKGHQVLYVSDSNGENKRLLTTTSKNETDPTWLDNNTIAYLYNGQIWKMDINGENRKQLTHDSIDIEGFKFSPNRKYVILLKSLPYYGSIKKNPSDLPKATGRLVTDMNYRHWDHYVETICHPFVAEVLGDKINEGEDILQENPMNVQQLLLAVLSNLTGVWILRQLLIPVERKRVYNMPFLQIPTFSYMRLTHTKLQISAKMHLIKSP